MSKLDDLCKTLLRLEANLSTVRMEYYGPDYEGDPRRSLHSEDGARKAGKWEVYVRIGDGMNGLGETPEAAVQDAINRVLQDARDDAAKAAQKAAQASEEALRLEALARPAPATEVSP